MDPGTFELGQAATPRRFGQACDRCRKKKIKCDGAFPTCRSCEKGALRCEASATLRRNTRVRGFATDEQRLKELQSELVKCQQRLKAEQDRSAALQHRLSRRGQFQVPPGLDYPARDTERPSILTQPQKALSDDPAYMIKHMGRMVHDQNGIGRFAGSTTGVHFVLSVEQECQKSLNLSSTFPECCFRLFLLQPSPIERSHITVAPQGYLEEIRQCLTHPSAYYCQQADTFIRNWEGFCPILVPKQLRSEIYELMGSVHTAHGTHQISCGTVLTVLMIMSINEVRNDNSETVCGQSSNSQRYLPLACRLIDRVTMEGDIKGLQALVLFALFNQLNDNCLATSTINGMMVSLAQSLGLHRHARRFKMKPGEVELRKRLWWWIYVFDRTTSLLHGLPTLINDVDVDNDMPLDCHLDDLDSTELIHPLPGERTAAFIFIQYVNLGRKLSRIREMLYTTTQRRNGAAKINDLGLDLRVWKQSLKVNGINCDVGHAAVPTISGTARTEIEETNFWLQIMANIAMVLVHRPGLSFDDTTAEFKSCLQACIVSSNALLSLLTDSYIPGWLRSLSMMGPSMVFQSALMHVYCQCKRRSLGPDGLPTLEDSLAMISKGISILKLDVLTTRHAQSKDSIYSGSITEAVSVLENLLSSLAEPTSPATKDSEYMAGGGVFSESPGDYFTDQSMNTNALDALNYVTTTDWLYDVEGPFMGFMDLSGS